MKTDQFDDEIRRKLLGLPADLDAGDAERIFGYVRAHRSGGFGGSGWGKSLLFGTGAVLLIGTLLFNLNQYRTIQRLYTSLDSLQHQFSQSQAQTRQVELTKSTDSKRPVRPDTVYITRYRDRIVTRSLPQRIPALDQSVIESNRQTSVPGVEATTPTQTVASPEELTDALVIPRAGSKLTPVAKTKNDSEPTETTDRVPGTVLDSALATHLSSEPAGRIAKKGTKTGPPSGQQMPNDPSQIRAVYHPANPPQIIKGRVVTSRQFPRNGSNEVAQLLFESNSNTPPMPNGHSTSRTVSVKQLAPTGFWRPVLATTINRQLAPVSVITVQPARRPFRLGLPQLSLPTINFPKLAVAGSSVWAGVSGGAGNEHLSSSVLGEWRFKPRWSVQSGIQYRILYGEGFDDDDHFETRTQQDFRTLYAPNVPRTDEIHDISQTYQLLQIPLTIAYHYSLGHDWSLRFGVGTSLDLSAVNRLTFDYRENGQSSERGFYQATIPVRVVNNLTISAGIERQWQGWLFRASPFISPQLTPVSYKPDNLYWGGQVQLLHHFGGRK